MSRSMLKTKKMLKEFWAEVVGYVEYLSNRCPTKGLNGITSQEAWKKVKCSSLESVRNHWLCVYKWSSKDQARWQE